MAKKLSDWARENGINPRHARRLYNEGKLPNARKISERIILVDDTTPTTEKTVIYARVSSKDQSNSLANQIAALHTWATNNNCTIHATHQEIASGLNDNRKTWNAILSDPTITTIIVEHRERATRFGYMQLQSALNAQGRRIIAINDQEIEDDLVRDITEILTSLCARLYGKRGARKRAEKALHEASAPND